jgi:glycosyltransferase involved in cell wall biosynthesis
MKVLFTFGGLPHYYNYVLSRLNSVENLEVVVVVPQSETDTIGKGVKQTLEGVNFKIIYLKEYNTPYGNLFLQDLDKTLLAEKPDVLVTIWPYILGFVFYFNHYLLLKRNHIKLIVKEIPFKMPARKGALKYYQSKEYLELNEDLQAVEKTGLKFRVKYQFLSLVRWFYYSFLVDATVNYINEAKEIISSYGLSKEKIFITSNSPDTDLIAQAYQKIKTEPVILPENPHRIIHVGRLVKWKKVHLIIEAMEFLKGKFPNIELVIIGTGPETDNLKQLAADSGLEQNLRFVGGVYNNETLGKYFLASQIYVLAGMGGLSINEAIAFGKPVVCSIADGTEKALVTEGLNGYYFKDDDALDLAKKIELLLSIPEKAEEMSANSLSVIANKINIHTVIKGYVEAFNYVSDNKFQLKYTK